MQYSLRDGSSSSASSNSFGSTEHPRRRASVVYEDSIHGEPSAGPGGSRLTVMLSGATAGASRKIKDKMLKLAAHLMETAADDLLSIARPDCPQYTAAAARVDGLRTVMNPPIQGEDRRAPDLARADRRVDRSRRSGHLGCPHSSSRPRNLCTSTYLFSLYPLLAPCSSCLARCLHYWALANVRCAWDAGCFARIHLRLDSTPWRDTNSGTGSGAPPRESR